MAQTNTGKWKVFNDGQILYGPSGTGQNLNTDLEKAIADESDAVALAAIGNGIVTGFEVTEGTGLTADVSAGVALIAGQRIRLGTPATVVLDDDTPDQKVYVVASTPWNVALAAWPHSLDKTTGSLPSDALLLATVSTVAGDITAVVDGRATFIEGQAAISGTIDDTETPAAAATSIRARLGMLANRVKAITGGADWLAAPAATVAAIWAKFHDSTGHAHTGSGSDGAPVAHSSLTGLTSGDPHTQYAKVAGAQFTGDISIKKNSPAARWIGTEGGNAKDLQVVEVNGFLTIQRNDGTEGTPVWVDILSIDMTNLTVTLRSSFPIRMSMGVVTGTSATPSGSGGALATNTYYYKVVSVDVGGNLSAPSAEFSAAVTGPTGSVALLWGARPGAVLYRIYRGTSPGNQTLYFTSTTAAFTDVGGGSTAGSPPAATALAFHTLISANGDGWIGGQTLGDKRNLHIGHQLRLDTMPAAALVLPNRYAQT